MLKKWSKVRGINEKEVAKAWAKSWAHDDWTIMRTGLNPFGGLPNDNQGLEANNGAQKADGGWKREGICKFTVTFQAWLLQESLNDVAMGMAMPKGRRPITTWSIDFFKQLDTELKRRNAAPTGNPTLGTGIFRCAFTRAPLVSSSFDSAAVGASSSSAPAPLPKQDMASRRLIALLTKKYKVSMVVQLEHGLHL